MNFPILLISLPDGSMCEFELTKSCIVLGRAADCDVVVEGKLISRHHARLCKVGQSYVLEDLGSQNGTSVNGQRISGEHALHDRDHIALGGVGKLIFTDSDSTSTLPLPSVEGIWLDASSQDVWVNGQRLNPRVSPAQFKLLQVLSERKDQICTRTEIVSSVWPNIAEGVSDEALDALIKRVRARLNEVANGEKYLTTLRGRGLVMRMRIE